MLHMSERQILNAADMTLSRSLGFAHDRCSHVEVYVRTMSCTHSQILQFIHHTCVFVCLSASDTTLHDVLVVVKNCAEFAPSTRAKFACDEMLGVLYDLLEGTEAVQGGTGHARPQYGGKRGGGGDGGGGASATSGGTEAASAKSARAMGERLMCQACDTLQELCGDAAVRERVCVDGAASKALKLLDHHAHSVVVQAVRISS